MASKVPYVLTSNSLTVSLAQRPYSIARGDKMFDEIVALIKGDGTEQDILAVINKAANAVAAATQVTPNISIQNGVVLYKGAVVDNSLTERMLRMLDEGFDLVPMALFLENLMQNPSYTAVKELYPFLEKGNMPITPDGHFMAYKAVRGDFKDIHSGTFDNSVGRVCEMPRSSVDDNRDRTCSAGLHFCSFEYLPHFAHANGHVMLLKINPKDVVSIPADYNDTKGRCARYEVVGEYEGYYSEGGPFFTSSVYDPATGRQSGFASSSDDGEFSIRDEDGDMVADGFETIDDALEYIENNLSSGASFDVVDEDGDVVDSADGGVSSSVSLYADGDFVDSFDSEDDARDAASNMSDSVREFTIEDEDGDVIATFDGDKGEFTVFVDGEEQDESYDDQEEACDKALSIFTGNGYTGSISVQDSDGEIVLTLNG